jgi:RimJ/RimL family protein N-acetyltransferase
LLDYAKTNTSCKKFTANVHRGNIASKKVLGKIGFKRVGEGEVFKARQISIIESYKY